MWVTGTNGLWSQEPDLVSYLEGEVDEDSGQMSSSYILKIGRLLNGTETTDGPSCNLQPRSGVNSVS